MDLKSPSVLPGRVHVDYYLVCEGWQTYHSLSLQITGHLHNTMSNVCTYTVCGALIYCTYVHVVVVWVMYIACRIGVVTCGVGNGQLHGVCAPHMLLSVALSLSLSLLCLLRESECLSLSVSPLFVERE